MDAKSKLPYYHNDDMRDFVFTPEEMEECIKRNIEKSKEEIRRKRRLIFKESQRKKKTTEEVEQVPNVVEATIRVHKIPLLECNSNS